MRLPIGDFNVAEEGISDDFGPEFTEDFTNATVTINSDSVDYNPAGIAGGSCMQGPSHRGQRSLLFQKQRWNFARGYRGRGYLSL